MARRDDIRLLVREARAAFAWRHLRRFLFRRGGFLIPLGVLLGAAFGVAAAFERHRLVTSQPAYPPLAPLSLLDPAEFDPDSPNATPRRFLDAADRYLVFTYGIRSPTGGLARAAVYDVKERRTVVYLDGGLDMSTGTDLDRRAIWLVGSRLVVARRGVGAWEGASGGSDWETNRDAYVRIATIDIDAGEILSEHLVESMLSVQDVDPTGNFAVGLAPDPLWSFGGHRHYFHRPKVVDLRTGESTLEPIQAQRTYFVNGETIGAITPRTMQGWRWLEDRPVQPIHSRPSIPDAHVEFLPEHGEVDPRDRSFHLPIWGDTRGPGGAKLQVFLRRIAPDGAFDEQVYDCSDTALGSERFDPYGNKVQVGFRSDNSFHGLHWELVPGLALRNASQSPDRTNEVRVEIVDLHDGSVHLVERRQFDPATSNQYHHPRIKFLGPRHLGILEPFEGGGNRWRVYPVSNFLYEGPPFESD